MIKAVIFDFDGTISDSSEGIMYTALSTVEKLGYRKEDYSKEYMRRFIGPPLRDCFRVTFGVEEEKIPFCVEEYRKTYDAKGLYMMKAYDGIKELLETLRAKGYKTAVATNKMQELAIRCISYLGLTDHFDYIGGPDSDGGITKAMVIGRALEALGVAKEEALMVGDTTNDQGGAEKAEVLFCPVSWGFGFTKEELEGRLHADVPSDIMDIVERLQKGESKMIERINTPEAPAAVGPYSQAVKANGFVFASGQLALDPKTGAMVGETAAEQAVQCFKNIEAVLKEAGSSMDKVVKAIVYLEDINDFGAVNQVYAEAFKSAPVLPARCAFQVAKLPKAGKVEIEVTAVL